MIGRLSTLLLLVSLLCTCGDRPTATAGATRVTENYPPYTIPARGYTSPATYPGYRLVWADEFDGENPDTASWSFLTGTGYGEDNSGWGNNEAQYYRAENTSVDSGLLVIEAREEEFGDRKYTSSRLTTSGKREFTYGRMDIRAALPYGRGIWPAIWMLGSGFPETIDWPAAGEIDIVEVLGHKPNTLFATVHYGQDYGSGYRHYGDSTELTGELPFHSEFHVFSIDWRRDTIEWRLDDGPPYHRFTATDAERAGQPYPFNAPQYFLLNVAVGGNWPGYPDSTTVFPQHMLVDYVRVFQRDHPGTE